MLTSVHVSLAKRNVLAYEESMCDIVSAFWCLALTDAGKNDHRKMYK
jgi:hypothetical protein